MNVCIEGNSRRIHEAVNAWRRAGTRIIPCADGAVDFIDLYGPPGKWGENTLRFALEAQAGIGVDPSSVKESGFNMKNIFVHNDFLYMPCFRELKGRLRENPGKNIRSAQFTFIITEQDQYFDIIVMLAWLFAEKESEEARRMISAYGNIDDSGRIEYCTLIIADTSPAGPFAVECSISCPESGIKKAYADVSVIWKNSSWTFTARGVDLFFWAEYITQFFSKNMTENILLPSAYQTGYRWFLKVKKVLRKNG